MSDTSETKENFEEFGDKVENVMKFVSSCNSFSEIIDKLCIENIRLWHILDDTIALKKELEKQWTMIQITLQGFQEIKIT